MGDANTPKKSSGLFWKILAIVQMPIFLFTLLWAFQLKSEADKQILVANDARNKAIESERMAKIAEEKAKEALEMAEMAENEAMRQKELMEAMMSTK